MTGTIENQLNSYIDRLNKDQKKSLLGFIKTFFPGKDQEKAYTLKDYNDELEEAEAEIKRGDFYTNDEVFKMSEKLIDARKSNKMV